MTFLPVFDAEHSSTRDKIITILASQPGQNTKQINNALKKQYAINVTYQAVHKTLKQMIDEGILRTDGRDYLINAGWLEKIKSFINKTENTIDLARSETQSAESGDSKTRVIEVNSLKEVDAYWLNFEKRALAELVKLPKEDRILYLYLPHCWFALSYPQNEHEFMNELKKIEAKVYYFCSGNTVVDRWVRDFYHKYPDSPYRIFLGVNAEPTSEKWISPFMLTDVIFPSGFLKVYDELYNKTADIKDLELGKFLIDVYEVREPIQIIENLSESVISNIRQSSHRRAIGLLKSENDGIIHIKDKFIQYWDILNSIPEASRTKVLDFGMGMPDSGIFRIPDSIKKKLHSSIDKNNFEIYEQQEGNSELLKEIMQFENKSIKGTIKLSTENLMMVPGAIMGYFLLLDKLIHPQDEIIMFRPMYFSQLYISKLKAKINLVDLSSEKSYFDDLKKNLNESTRAVALVNPNNPTGKFIPVAEIEKIIEYCKNRNIYVIIDESCAVYIYNETNAGLPINITEPNVIRIKSFSKLHNISGYRLGYIMGPKNIIMDLRHNVPAIYGNPTVMANEALIEDFKIRNLEKPDESYNKIYETNYKLLKENRDIAYKALKQSQKIRQVILPDACYYIFFQYKEGKGSFKIFQELLSKKDIDVFPGSIFGMPEEENWMRLCFAREPKILKEGLKRILDY